MLIRVQLSLNDDMFTHNTEEKLLNYIIKESEERVSRYWTLRNETSYILHQRMDSEFLLFTQQ